MADVDTALRLIIARSENVSGEAVRALRSTNRPGARPVQHALESALREPAGTFTAAERELIASCLSGATSARDVDVRMRVTAEEKQQIQALADAESGGSVSTLLRQRLGLAL
jgi:hypothetical protein